jgi:hypothetical protein
VTEPLHIHKDGNSPVLRLEGGRFGVWLSHTLPGGERARIPYSFDSEDAAQQVAEAFAGVFALARQLGKPVQVGSQADPLPPPATLWACSCGVAHGLSQQACEKCGDHQALPSVA